MRWGVAVVGLVALTACSGGGGVSTESSATSPPDTTTPATTTSTTTTTTSTTTTSTTTTTTTLPDLAPDGLAPFGEQPLLADAVARQGFEPVVCTPVAADVAAVDVRVAWTVGDRLPASYIVESPGFRPSTFEIELVVQGIDDQGTVEFEFVDDRAGVLDILPPDASAELLAAGQAAADNNLRYEVDSAGILLGTTNADELAAAGNAFIDLVVAEFPDLAAEDPEGLELVRSLFDAEAIESLLLDSAYAIHAFEGFTLDPAEVDSIPDSLPNPFGGPAFRQSFSVGVAELVDESGCVLLEQRFAPDADDVVEILQSMLERGDLDGQFSDLAGPPTDDELIEVAEILASTDIYQAQYDAGTGRIVRVAFGRFTASSGDRASLVELFVFTD